MVPASSLAIKDWLTPAALASSDCFKPSWRLRLAMSSNVGNMYYLQLNAVIYSFWNKKHIQQQKEKRKIYAANCRLKADKSTSTSSPLTDVDSLGGG